ncbi:MAG: hypothetical protein L6R35_007256 [Caloplaca aegaea]|nr:MAG: hypothetical protein L6R35_007256 [Caloplaca aegaea]
MELWAYPVAKKNGFYFLALASQSCSAWVAPIKVHMLYYFKLTEIYNQIDERIDVPIDQTEVATEGRPCAFQWWLEQQKVEFFELFRAILHYENTTFPTVCLRLSFAVAANLLFMVDPQKLERIDRSWLSIVREFPWAICLLQIAIGGPDIVAAQLQDRTAMVVKLLSTIGYPPDYRSSIPLVLSAVEDSSTPEIKKIQELIREHQIQVSPIEFLLSKCGRVRLSDNIRLSILKELCGAHSRRLDNKIFDFTGYFLHSDGVELAAEPWTTLLAFCARNESEDFVSFLLQRGADFHMRDSSGWLPIDYALLRQDEAVLAAFSKYQSGPLGAEYSELFRRQHNLESLVSQSSTVFSSCGHPGLAILMARSLGRRFEGLLKD